jgi:hydroxymethylpyrimidine/phosphomethylpyrimidine kinase
MSFLEEMLGVKSNDPMRDEDVPVALTIAGSDSGGGAGVQADLKAFAAQRVHGASALTLVTAQNTRGVSAVHMLPAALMRDQVLAVKRDLDPAAAKTGALGSEEMIRAVRELLDEHPFDKLVVDPVMVSKHGDALLPGSAQRALRDYMLEPALLVTPNRYEAEAMTGRPVGDLASMKDAAKRLFDFGATYVLIKGPHLGSIVRDIVYDGTGFVEFGADRVDSKRVHGSGCVFSATITARLALGDEVLEAIDFARQFITAAIEHAPRIGHGVSPVNPLHALWGPPS